MRQDETVNPKTNDKSSFSLNSFGQENKNKKTFVDFLKQIWTIREKWNEIEANTS